MPLFGLLFIYKGYKRIPKSLLYAPLNRYFFMFRMSFIQFESQPGVQLTPSCSLMFTNATQFQYMRARAVNQIKKRCTVILEEKSNQNLKDFCGSFISAQVLFFSANYQIIRNASFVGILEKQENQEQANQVNHENFPGFENKFRSNSMRRFLEFIQQNNDCFII